jgi:PilZ domain
MNLPDELFKQITESITIVGETESLPGDRRAPRLKLQTHVPVFPWSSPVDAMSVRIRDLSVGGIGILHSQRMALDSQFVVRMPTAADQHALLVYTVVYWEPLAENLIAIGAEFERVISESQLTMRQQEVTQESSGIIARFTHAIARVGKLAS